MSIRSSIACLLSLLSASAALSQTMLFAPNSGTVGSSSNSNVGIGTASPGQALSVSGSLIEVYGSNAFTGISLRNTSGSGGREYRLVSNDTTSLGGGFVIYDQTAAAARLKIDALGKVGIGTTAPATRLHIAGEDAQIGFGRTTGDTNAYGRIGATPAYDTYWTSNATFDGTNWNYVNTSGWGGFATRIDQRLGNLYLDAANGGTNPITWNTRLFVANGGHVGIGTTTPARKLTVVGGHGDSLIQLFSTSYGQGIDGANTAVLSLWAGEPGWTWTGAGIGNNAISTPSGGVHRETTTRGGSYMRLLDNQIILSTIDSNGGDSQTVFVSNGKVGIGTSTLSHRLVVGGTIRAHEVVVETGWADHVFADGYQLAPLDEIENHIRDKKHLPGVPTAAEVAERGISIGAMQAKLLEKIEEMTLRQIGQGKEMQQLRRENEELRERVRILEEIR